MQILLTRDFESNSLDDTTRLGAAIGERLKGGEVLELISDLGGGKTAFVRGLAEGAGSSDRVSSPSFTLRNEYKTPTLTIYHFDFYRLSEPGIMSQELAETLEAEGAVTVVEWATIVKDVLPQDHMTIRITATGENSRSFLLSCPANFEYLLGPESEDT